MIWTLYVWATFLTPNAEPLSDFANQAQCHFVAQEWVIRMLAYRTSQHLNGNIVAWCTTKPVGQLP